MNIKILVFSMLIIATAFSTCVEARRRHKSHRTSSISSTKTKKHDSNSGHSTSGSSHSHKTDGSGHNTVQSGHSTGKSEHSHTSNTGGSESVHTGGSASGHNDGGSLKQHSTATGQSHAVGGEHHMSPDNYPQQPAYNPNYGYPANPHSDTTHGNNQPVYVINNQNSQSSGSDDFSAGFAAGSGAARRYNRRRTTTAAPKTTATPTTTRNPCVNGAQNLNTNEPQQQYGNLEGQMPNQNYQPQTQNAAVNCQPEVVNPPLATYSTPTYLAPIENITPSNTGY